MSETAQIEKLASEFQSQKVRFEIKQQISLTTNFWNRTPNNIFTDSEDFLFFPRTKIKTTKVNFGDHELDSWFIEKRLSEKTARLDLPTDLTKEGIASGFRSLIILDNEGEYLKLKGVHPGFIPTKVRKRGICSFIEAVQEQIGCHYLTSEENPFVAARPAFIEPYIPISSEKNSYVENKTYLKMPLKLSIDSKAEFISVLDEFGLMHENDAKSIQAGAYVSALKIKGDTRLDELVWHLTKKPLKNKKRKVRDELLEYVFFRAGIAKASLTASGMAWGKLFSNTNSHIGNFVVYNDENLASIGLVDFYNSAFLSQFETIEHFKKHVKMENVAFMEDIEQKATMSPTVQLVYRHFPHELRLKCFNALMTGYSTYLLIAESRSEVLNNWKFETPTDIIKPSEMFIATKDFRERLNYIMS